MLSGVLKSSRANEANVAIMRAFVQLRRDSRNYEALNEELGEVKESLRRLENKHDQQTKFFQDVFRKWTIVNSQHEIAVSRSLADQSTSYDAIEKAIAKYYGLSTKDLKN